MTYNFHWTCSYMDTVDYHVFGDGQRYTATVRRTASEYEKSIYNHASPCADWDRDVVASIGLIHRSDSRFPISQEVVDAFNAWQLAKHEAFLQLLQDHPEKYGEITSDDPIVRAPPPVRGAFYRVGTGWIIN